MQQTKMIQMSPSSFYYCLI